MSEKDFHAAMGAFDTFRTIMLARLVETVCAMAQPFCDTAFEPLYNIV